MSQLRLRCWTKGTTRAAGTPTLGIAWALARRGWLKIYDDRVECGDWRIPIDRIEAATVFLGRQLFFTGRVLEIRTNDTTYQFGVNPWVRVETALPFPHKVERVVFGYSWLSIAVRVLVIGYLVWLVLRRP